jgi:hypothetical protein
VFIIMHANTTFGPEVRPPEQPARKSRKWPRRLAIGAALAVTLVIGIVIGGASHNTGVSQTTFNAAQAQASALKSQVSSLKGQLSGLRTQVSNDSAAVATAQSKAATAQQTANSNAAAAYKSKDAALQATYQSKEAALAQTQQTASQDAATLKSELGQVQANTINGDGTYVVGQNIKSGTYQTKGSGDTGQDDCYYATLSSTDGSINSIIANGNFDGPETISLSGVYAFQVNGPCTWVLIP